MLMKQDLTTARKFAEAHLDQMMADLHPNIGFTFDISNTAFLCDLANRRLILDREPTDAERECLMAYSVELELRTSDKMAFELDGSLYHRDQAKGEYTRYFLDTAARKWKSESLSLLDYIAISNFHDQQTVSEADRARRAAEDMKRLQDVMEKKPDSVKE